MHLGRHRLTALRIDADRELKDAFKRLNQGHTTLLEILFTDIVKQISQICT